MSAISVTLSLTGDHHDQLRHHLFSGDGLEAVAVLLCGRRKGDRRHRLLVREIHEIPHEACERSPGHVYWNTDLLADLLDKAEREQLSVLKIHSHPNGYPRFSHRDDASDADLLPAIRGWVGADIPHGSAVMLPDGAIFGRVFDGESMSPIAAINVVGDDLLFWYSEPAEKAVPDFAASHAQAFDEGTIERLQRLSVAVIGCSGTGSPTIEQLFRLGVGEIVIVDDDVMKDRNVNRIVYSTMKDVEDERCKTDVLGDAVERSGLPTKVIRMPANLWNPEVVTAVAQCDVVFGCMDTVDGRYLLNMLATFYVQAYFDIGVRLDADNGDIREICGSVHYLRPGKSSLITRELFTMEQVAAAGLRRTDPEAHRQEREEGYIAGVEERRPAVISVNMFASSLAVNEFLARLHPYREESNGYYSAVTFSLSSMEIFHEPEAATCKMLVPHVGKGDVRPLLRMPELSERRPK